MTRFDAWALGYPDELSVRPGETVRFHVSGAGAETVAVSFPGFFPLLEQVSQRGEIGG